MKSVALTLLVMITGTSWAVDPDQIHYPPSAFKREREDVLTAHEQKKSAQEHEKIVLKEAPHGTDHESAQQNNVEPVHNPYYMSDSDRQRLDNDSSHHSGTYLPRHALPPRAPTRIHGPHGMAE